MLRNLSHKRKELRLEQSRVDNQFIRLMNDLQLSLQTEEDLTVILADAFATTDMDAAEAEQIAFEVERQDDRNSSVQQTSSPPAEERNDTVDIQKPSRLNQPTNVVQRPQPTFGCFAAEGLFSVYSADQSDLPAPQPRAAQSSSPTNNVIETRHHLFPSSSHPSPSALRAGAQAWRERHGQAPKEGIDFRTGMSGHMALLSTHAHPHEFLDSAVPSYSSVNTGMLRMSSHTGLTMSKSRFRGILSSLTLPSFGATQNERREELHPSGSM